LGHEFIVAWYNMGMQKSLKHTSVNYNFYIKADTSAYKGEWIAIAKKKIIAHGNDAEKVYQQATKKFKSEEISLAKVPEEQTLILKLIK
jgi:hypothetical protein